MAANPTGLSNAMATTNVFSPGASTGAPVPYPTGGPGNYNFGNATNPNPPGTGAGAPSMFPGAGAGTPPGVNLDPTGTHQLEKTLAGTYHTGLGKYYGSLLQSQGGYNAPLTTQSIQDQIAAMQTNIERGAGTLNTQLAQQGISPSSSVSALENAFYQSEATTQENALVANEFYNMWNQSMGREFQFAESLGPATAQEKAGESTMSKLQGIGQFVGDIIGNSGVTWSL